MLVTAVTVTATSVFRRAPLVVCCAGGAGGENVPEEPSVADADGAPVPIYDELVALSSTKFPGMGPPGVGAALE